MILVLRKCGGRDSNPRRPEPRDLLPEASDLKSRPFGQSRVPPRECHRMPLIVNSLCGGRGAIFKFVWSYPVLVVGP